ncbi:hypothetical protein NDU88_002811 [Pleurodeles waltl]|uniref:Uncharacterized protein n=1 Tax=Pleurodeles waltl TaxID=8319 RepID=A0AAV7UCJ9_PLEWA|nr:hypothetical protein NDU88_002811 [Pleurodeles waltl]
MEPWWKVLELQLKPSHCLLGHGTAWYLGNGEPMGLCEHPVSLWPAQGNRAGPRREPRGAQRTLVRSLDHGKAQGGGTRVNGKAAAFVRDLLILSPAERRPSCKLMRVNATVGLFRTLHEVVSEVCPTEESL